MDIEKNEIAEMDTEAEENITDSSTITIDSFERALVVPMDLSVEMIVSWFNSQKLELDPSFQRRIVWDSAKMSLFIESLILNVPIPSILLANDEKKNVFLVIDGKQRLNAILSFVSPSNDGKGFKLRGLQVLKELNGYTYNKLAKDSTKIEFFTKIENAIIKTNVLKKHDTDLLYFIFSRLNSGSVALSTQELRQSLFPGRFVNFTNEYAVASVGIKRVLGLKAPDKRMRDSELLVRYYSFKYFRNEYDGRINEFFNKTCEILNNDWEQEKVKINKDADELEQAIKFVYEKFGDDAFRSYFINEDSEFFGPFNRPMFDLMTSVFSVPENRSIIDSKKIDLKALTIKLYRENKVFAEAFLPTTHSKEKTQNRFNEFNKALDLLK